MKLNKKLNKRSRFIEIARRLNQREEDISKREDSLTTRTRLLRTRRGELSHSVDAIFSELSLGSEDYRKSQKPMEDKIQDIRYQIAAVETKFLTIKENDELIELIRVEKSNHRRTITQYEQKLAEMQKSIDLLVEQKLLYQSRIIRE